METLQAVAGRLTFEEFFRLPEEEIAYELVDGRLDRLMAPDMKHGAVQLDIGYYLRAFLGDNFQGYLGVEVDIPTVPFYGRRPDVIYLAPEHVTPEDVERGYPLHPPDLVVEVVSAGQEKRDTIEKRSEYARAGIQRYWILDPGAATVQMLLLGEGSEYSVESHFAADDTLTSPLFPGLTIPLRSLFRRLTEC